MLRRSGLTGRKINPLIRPVAEADSPLFEIIGRHLYLHPVAGENAHAVYPHASRQRAQNHMILRLGTKDAYLERRVRERFFHNSDKFDYVLRHKSVRGYKPKEPTVLNGRVQPHGST